MLTRFSVRYRDAFPRRHRLQYCQRVCSPAGQTYTPDMLIRPSFCALEAGATHIDTSVLGSESPPSPFLLCSKQLTIFAQLASVMASLLLAVS